MFGLLKVEQATRFAEIYRLNGDTSSLVQETISARPGFDLKTRCKRVLCEMQAEFDVFRGGDEERVAEHVLIYERVFGRLNGVAQPRQNPRFVALRPDETVCCGKPVEVVRHTHRSPPLAGCPAYADVVGIDEAGTTHPTHFAPLI